MNTRFNLNNNLVDKIPLNHGGIQNRLYKNALWGCYNCEGIKISKLELSLWTLFPFNLKYLSLELKRIRNFIKNEWLTSFDLELNIIQYCFYKDIIFVSQQYDLNIPLMDLPRLSKDGILIINGTKKTLITQVNKTANSIIWSRK